MRNGNPKKNRKSSSVPQGKKELRTFELLGGAVAGAIALLIVSIFLASSLDRYLLSSSQYASVIAAVLVDLANADRSSQSVGTLTVNPILVAAAQAKADDMAKYSYFAHVSPQGVEPWHWFKEAGYAFDYAGENLAVDFSDSSDVNSAWMNSPTHRQNLLDPHFTEIGIATAQGSLNGHTTTFVVQEFGTPSPKTRELSAIAHESVPVNPKEPALATTKKTTGPNVLGENAAGQKKAAPAKTPPIKIEMQPAQALPAAHLSNAPAWGYLATSPKTSLRYAYYAIGLLIILLFLIATGLELRWHHRKKFAIAGTLLLLMCGLFLIADTVIFSNPVLASSEKSTHS